MEHAAHDSWAHLYDLVSERSYGPVLARLTASALSCVEERAPGEAVLDLGAGTGRLAVPLAERGHRVTAVERSAAMAALLLAKAAARGVTVDVREHDVARLGDLGLEGHAVALCLFTVVHYLTTADALAGLAAGVAASLRPGGGLLVDVAEPAVFRSARFFDRDIERSLVMTPCGGLWRYEEDSRLRVDGVWHRYRDSFPLRAWTAEEVAGAIEAAGLEREADVSARFRGSFATHLWFRRP